MHYAQRIVQNFNKLYFSFNYINTLVPLIAIKTGFHTGNANSTRKRNHYVTLQIPSSATQNEIKGAYYKLSMAYHPDQTKGNKEAILKFREITEAYEVLSNVHKRRMYDKSHRLHSVSTTAEEFGTSQHTRQQREFTSSRGRFFDEQTDMNRATAFRRKQQHGRNFEHYKVRLDAEAHSLNAIHVFGAIFFIFVIGRILPFTNERSNKKEYVEEKWTVNNSQPPAAS